MELREITPKPSIADSGLSRPNWLTSIGRTKDTLWLDKNENLDPALLKVTQKILAELDPLSLCTYPDAVLLYQKLSKFVGVPAEHLLLTAGSDGVIRTVFETYVSEKDLVLVTQPTFAMYPVYCKMFGARMIPLQYEPGVRGPHLSTERILSAMRETKPRLFCFPNPDSPTGTVKSESELREILRCAQSTQTMVLIDEAYHPFYRETVAPWTKEFENLIVARTFAKAWGLSGLRSGYAVAHPKVAAYLHKVRPMYEINTVAVNFLEKMMDHESDMWDSVVRLTEGKKYFLSQMKEMGFRVLEGEGNFLHVAFGEKQEVVFKALDGLVLYRKDFSEDCLKGFSRFSITTKDLFQPIVEKIRGCL